MIWTFFFFFTGRFWLLKLTQSANYFPVERMPHSVRVDGAKEQVIWQQGTTGLCRSLSQGVHTQVFLAYIKVDRGIIICQQQLIGCDVSSFNWLQRWLKLERRFLIISPISVHCLYTDLLTWVSKLKSQQCAKILFHTVSQKWLSVKNGFTVEPSRYNLSFQREK